MIRIILMMLISFNSYASNSLFNFALENTQEPTTDYITTQTHRITTEWPLIWVNRCADIFGQNTCPNNRVYKGNAYTPMHRIDGIDVRPQFTTVKKADACTRMNAARALKINDRYIRTLSDYFDIQYIEASDVPTASVTTLNLKNKTYHYLIDTCVLIVSPNKRPTTLVFDYEVHDRRSPKELAFLVNRLKFHSRNTDIMWYTNSLHRESTRKNNGMYGVGLESVIKYSDYVGIVVWSGASPNRKSRQWSPVEDFLVSLSFIGQEKIVPFVSLYDVSVDEAKEIRSYLKDPVFGIWRHFQKWEDNLPLINCLAGISCR